VRHAEDRPAPRSRRKALIRTDIIVTAIGLLVVLLSGPITARASFDANPTPGPTQPTQTQPTQTQPTQTQTQTTQGSTPDSTPPAPTGVSVTAGDGTVSLSWDKAPGATSYAVYTGTSESFSVSTRRLTVDAPGATLTGLTNGTVYYFWVTAANSTGPSSPSGAVKATPVAPATVPGAPVMVKVTGKNGGAAVTWAAPASDGGSPITGYQIYAATSADFRGGLAVVKLTGASYVLSGLIESATWYFKVAAINARGVGPASAVVSVIAGPAQKAPPTQKAPPSHKAPPTKTPPARPATPVRPVTPTQPAVPGAPTSISAAAGPGRAILWWTSPSTGQPSTGQAAISGYHVFVGTRPGGESATPAGQTLVHGTSVALAGLTSGIRYYFTVAAVGADGRQGAPSAEVTTVPLTPAGAGPMTGVLPAAGSGQVAAADSDASAPASVIQVADQDGSVTDSGSPAVSLDRRPPHAIAIIVLSGVATAALAGAVGAALHLRRRRRLSLPPAGQPGRKPVDSITGQR
jgi:hypothetical protein